VEKTAGSGVGIPWFGKECGGVERKVVVGLVRDMAHRKSRDGMDVAPLFNICFCLACWGGLIYGVLSLLE
jgi:hypothetical protein